MATKIIELIRPQSETNIIYEEYEWLLAWFSRSGSLTYWMFKDWQQSDDADVDAQNVKDKDLIGNTINSEQRIVELIAEDITRDQLKAFQDLKTSKNVYRIHRSDTVLYDEPFEKLALNNNQIQMRQRNQRFTISLQIQRHELALAR
jgi:hypothetical protein